MANESTHYLVKYSTAKTSPACSKNIVLTVIGADGTVALKLDPPDSSRIGTDFEQVFRSPTSQIDVGEIERIQVQIETDFDGGTWTFNWIKVAKSDDAEWSMNLDNSSNTSTFYSGVLSTDKNPYSGFGYRLESDDLNGPFTISSRISLTDSRLSRLTQSKSSVPDDGELQVVAELKRRTSADVRKVIEAHLKFAGSSGVQPRLPDYSYVYPSVEYAKELIHNRSTTHLLSYSRRFDCDDYAICLKADFAKDAEADPAIPDPYAFGIIWGDHYVPNPNFTRFLPVSKDNPRMIKQGGHAVNWMIADDGYFYLIEPQREDMIFCPWNFQEDVRPPFELRNIYFVLA